MKIKCSSIEEEKEESLEKIKYLLFENDKGQEFKMPLKDFIDLYEKGKFKKATVSSDISVANETTDFVVVDNVESTDYSESLYYILNFAGISGDNKITEDEEFIIRSELDYFLHLPWERVVGLNTIVYRHVIVEDVDIKNTDKNNFLMVLSHSYKYNNSDAKEDLNSSISNEITKIKDILTKENKPAFRLEKIDLLKHATKDSVEKLRWSEYNFVHLVMHGEENSDLCLEGSNYEFIHRYSKSEFVSFLKSSGGINFECAFLSFCFSGGGGPMDTCLCFDLVKSGLTKHCLSYYGGVGSETASRFSTDFYTQIAIGQDVTSSYKHAIKELKKNNQNKYIPVFYTKDFPQVKV